MDPSDRDVLYQNVASSVSAKSDSLLWEFFEDDELLVGVLVEFVQHDVVAILGAGNAY